MAARWAHNPKVVGSNPAPATFFKRIVFDIFRIKDIILRDGAVAARWAHNPKVVGSNPAPATKR